MKMWCRSIRPYSPGPLGKPFLGFGLEYLSIFPARDPFNPPTNTLRESPATLQITTLPVAS